MSEKERIQEEQGLDDNWNLIYLIVLAFMAALVLSFYFMTSYYQA